jgi:WD40 repeat protein
MNLHVITLDDKYLFYSEFIEYLDEDHLLLPYETSESGDTYPASTTYRVWDIAAVKEVRKLTIGGSLWENPYVKISPDRKYIATGSERGVIRLWDIQTGKELGEYC